MVAILKSGKTRDPLLATITRNIFMEAAQLDIFLKFSHISGVANTIADLLSRWQNTEAQMKQLDRLAPGAKWLKCNAQSCFLDFDI